ncbi:hypothetical protein F4779DRAFT_633091 [Xylariaceae sp. FL0662B]|nr:hypothetical protein F4779DRAFT_633091 [Xylariaceae sp. FL0662B]
MIDPSSTAAGGDATATTAVSGVVIGLAIASVVLRFYTRYSTKAGFRWDDWMILLALVSTIFTGILVLWATAVDPDGAWVTSNSDPNYVYTDANITHLKLSFVASILYFTIACSTKLSILFMYNRLFAVSESFRRQAWVVGSLVVGLWIGCTVTTLTNCRPLEWSWLNSLSDARYCINYNIFWMASGAIEAVIDVLIIAMPVRLVLGLQMSRRRKVTVAGVFTLGAFVIVTGIVKVILGYIPGSRVPSYIRTEVWTTVHVGMGIVCACLPVCWPLISRMPKFMIASTISVTSLGKHWYAFGGWSRISKTDTGVGLPGSHDGNIRSVMEFQLPVMNHMSYSPDLQVDGNGRGIEEARE